MSWYTEVNLPSRLVEWQHVLQFRDRLKFAYMHELDGPTKCIADAGTPYSSQSARFGGELHLRKR
jgi:hypothetical protein